jgi:hypothetical protein
MLTYLIMNMKRTWQGYGARSCLRLMLNKQNEMRGPIYIYTPLGIQFKEAYKETFMYASNIKAYWEPFKLKINYELIETQLKVNSDLTSSQLEFN